MTATAAPESPRWKRITSGLLLALSVFLVLVGTFAGWLRIQLLDTDVWVETSRTTLADPAVQDALTTWAVAELFEAVDTRALISEALPPRLSPLAAPIAAAARQGADRAAERAMASDAVETAWVVSNQRAHERFVRLVNGDAPILVETASGIELDLRPLLERLAEPIGVDPAILDRLPAGVGTVQPARGEGLVRALEAVRLLDAAAPWIIVLSIVTFAGGIALGAGNRRRLVLRWGLGVAVAGVAVTVLRNQIGPVITDVLTDAAVWDAAVLATWGAVSEQLALSGRALMIVGLIAAAGAWVGGSSRGPAWLRDTAGPRIAARPTASWLGLWALGVLLIFSSDALGSRSGTAQIMMVLLAGAGSLALTREVSRPLDLEVAGLPETPDHVPG